RPVHGRRRGGGRRGPGPVRDRRGSDATEPAAAAPDAAEPAREQREGRRGGRDRHQGGRDRNSRDRGDNQFLERVVTINRVSKVVKGRSEERRVGKSVELRGERMLHNKKRRSARDST